ncbi:MarR family transcriptional regulator [Phenylobacterium sp.]|uniref:MarR family winged helix-turn-helix transcriptional regulator n=1 Tax=Phenylobacterium sp. TaxID=1871053 RepID=UPI00301DDCFC
MVRPPVEKLGGAPHSKQSLRLWLRLLSCSIVIEKRVRTRLAESFGTTLPRFDVLAALDRNPDGLKMSELSDWLLVSKGNVTAIVDRLIGDGAVERLQDESDRRILRVRLTPPGRAQFVRMAAAHEAWLDHIMAGLSAPEVEDLLASLQRLRQSIEENPI